jgi:hypothetical protein
MLKTNFRNTSRPYTYLLFQFTTGCVKVEWDYSRFGLIRSFTPYEHDNHSLVGCILSKLLTTAYYFMYCGNFIKYVQSVRIIDRYLTNFRTTPFCARLLASGHLEITFISTLRTVSAHPLLLDTCCQGTKVLRDILLLPQVRDL